MRQLIAIIILVVLFVKVKAQQHPLFSQYIFNGLTINPAYAGSRPYMTLNSITRKQWVGVDRSPFTQSIAWHGPLKDKKSGLGFVFNHDRAGIVSQSDVYGSYSYHISLPRGKFSMGLSGGASFIRSQLSDAVIWDAGDAVYNANSISITLPNFGAGAYYYHEKYYAGLSVPQIISYYNRTKGGDQVAAAHRPTPHYYLHTGMVIEGKNDIDFKPSVLLKYVKAAPVQYDINLNLLFSKILWVGAGYRSGDAITVLLEYQTSRQLRLGYSFDYTLSRLQNTTFGSHEISIGYDFGYDILKIKNPRYF
ncbi:MAG: type IX secretion system membrane protein PorP/SprF [Bacteroidetes bacterium]|nr:type IX secretion system membrane protein PorP/SprF [Bacteroidota bacterium]